MVAIHQGVGGWVESADLGVSPVFLGLRSRNFDHFEVAKRHFLQRTSPTYL